MPIVKKKTLFALIKAAIQKKDRNAFQEAIQDVQPGRFINVESWHECLRIVLEPDFDEDASFFIEGLLRLGGDENDAQRLLLLNDEIDRLGKFEGYPEDDRDEEISDVAKRIISETLTLYPALAWTGAADTGRTLFHRAAESGTSIAIEVIGDFIRQHREPDDICNTVRIRDTANNQTALVIAVRGNHINAVEALMRLDPDQLNESNPGSQIDIENAVEEGRLGILKILLTNRPRLVTRGFFERALDDKKLDILRYLISLAPELLTEPRANFLITAVKKGQVHVVKMLIENFPALTSVYEKEEQPGSASKIHYILAFNSDRWFKADKVARAAIRDLLLPVIIERNKISMIRKFLSDSVDLNKEICLDLSAYTYDSAGLSRFLGMVKADLSAHRVKELPPENIMSAFVGQLLERDTESYPQMETFLAQLYRMTTSLGQEPVPNGHTISPKATKNPALNGSDHGQAVGALSSLFERAKSGSNASVDPAPLFHIEFEPTLKYVELPSFDKVSAPRREEGKEILDWLRHCKGVTRIFELRARDSLNTPHHDEETIEEALQGLNIQVLDWQRPDLSIDTIRVAAPDVRILHLYSSGNWAAIDHWLGSTGVRTLEKLEDLHVTIVSDNISTSRASQYKDKVINRLKEYFPGPRGTWKSSTVDIAPWHTTKTNQGDSKVQEDLLTPNKVMELEEFIKTYKELSTNSEYSEPWNHCHTKVAIIDSGVDRCIFTGDQREVVGASFVHNHDGSKESPWWLAEDHHGSQMAHIITSLDPCCLLYIAKVAEYKSKVDKDLVTEAIRWAIKEKVDVINMSLVLYTDDPALQSAIDDAHNAGIVIFCATADKGFTPQDIYPAKWSKTYDSIFPICSSNSNGRITEYSSETAAHYTFQGEDIIANVGGTRISGSSVATAMATGVASLVLTCHRMLHASHARDFNKSLPGPNSRTAVIKRAFTKMCAEGMSKTPLVMPSLLFPKKVKKGDKYPVSDPDELHEWLMEELQKVLTED